MTSTYWKFRAELADRPGGLVAAASAIAELGANILDVDVHLVAADRVAGDMTVELAYWNEPGAVEHALLAAGADRVSGRRLDPPSLDLAKRLRLSATEVARAQALLDLAAAVKGERRSPAVTGER